jgi:hypothetical protein
MIMDVILDETYLAKSESAEVDVTIHVSAKVNITPFVARQKVNGLVIDHLGPGLISESPALVASNKRLVWRVPVVLTLPHRGRLGQVGTIDVDVQTGELLADDLLLANIAQTADDLAKRTT